MMFLKPGVTYPTFGFHYLLQSIILRVSNSQFFCVLFGDSSFIMRYMRYVGWNLNKVEQTGSNMGTNQRHDNPFLCNIGSGTMVSDGLSMINTHMSATSFQLAEVEDRRQQLSRQRHLLSAERQDRRERPARHQDHDPDRRSGARECRPARFAGLRNPAHGRSRPRHECVDRRRRRAASACARRTSTTSSPRCSSSRAAGCRCSPRWCCGPPRSPTTTASACSRCSPPPSRSPAGIDRVLRAARAREPALQAARAEDRLDLRSVFLVPRAALEAFGIADHAACSPARRSAP